jgi:glucokinase
VLAEPGPPPLRIGVDVGGTRLKLAALRGEEVAARAVVALASRDRSPAALVERICGAILGLAGAAAGAPAAVGLGVAGVLDAAGARVLQSPNLPWLDGAPLPGLLARRLGCPVRADNDANCVGWGEARAGAGRGVARQACLVLGTGVGGALVLDGALLRGGRGRGAELGHLCVALDGPPCGCGGRGCLEQVASQTGLARAARAAGLVPAALPAPDALRWLAAALARDEAPALRLVEAAADALADVSARLARCFDLERVVLAGGLVAALPALAPAVAERLRGAAAALPGWPAPGLSLGALGDDAGPIGAALLGAPPAEAGLRPGAGALGGR